MSHTLYTRVLIVGAGPAGLGVSLALQRAGVIDQLVVDSRDIGASFQNWTRGMSLLTPSFHSNAFGLTDLNAIDPESSPADFLRTQHPTGSGYADYLKAVAAHHKLPVRIGIQVQSIEKIESDFVVKTDQGEIVAEFVVWAAGQFFHPREKDFPGADLALHHSRIRDWNELEGEAFAIIGGYESGIDSALNLIERGKSVCLFSRGEPWNSDDPDPSRALSPRSFDRLRAVLESPEKSSRLKLIKNTNICSIEAQENHWIMRDNHDTCSISQTRPILANGFESGLGLVASHFEYNDDGLPIFSEEADESTLTPGLFYSGPALVHRDSLFCFIYKFRARFGVIAGEIAQGLGLPHVDEKLLPYLKAGFMNSDLVCCANCQCAIESTVSVPNPSKFS